MALDMLKKMISVRDHHWDSHKVNKLELKYALTVAVYVIIIMASLREHHWESHFDQRVELI